jgi:hypothetical protein
MIGGQLIGHNAPDYQERVVKFNELVAKCAIYSTALDITDAANALAAEGHLVDPDDPATVSSSARDQTHRTPLRRLALGLTPPKEVVATRLDLAPQSAVSHRASVTPRRPRLNA